MKFIHTADLHLGSPFKGLTNLPSAIRQAVHNSIYQAFDTLVAQAIDLKVDFIVIAGDEFDNVERDLQAQLYLQQKFLELAQHHIPVFLIYGNHDYLTSSQAIVSYPSNVHVFGPQISTVTLKLVSGLRIAVSGFSYDQNHLTANKAQSYPARLDNVDYQIGILHGEIGQTNQNNYAPFSVEDLQSKGYDYWALGHIHQRQIINKNPYIVYPGNLQGRHRKETGAKGYYLVEWDGQQTNLEFRAVAPIIWQNQQLDVARIQDLDTLIKQITQTIANKQNTLVELTFTNYEKLSTAIQGLIDSGELLATLQKNTQSEHFNYIYRFHRQFTTKTIYQAIDEPFWKQAAQDVFTKANLQQHLGKLQQVAAIRDVYQNPDFLAKLQQTAINIISQNKMED